MRGSLNNQITAALKMILRIGSSRHEAKQDYGGRSPFIHSVGTFDKSFHRLAPLGAWLRSREIRDLEALDASTIGCYLESRFGHHVACGSCRKSFQAELSALAALERGLTLFSRHYRDQESMYDFSAQRRESARQAKALPLKTSTYQQRAILYPEQLIATLPQEKHQLMARLQWEGGCRTEGVGAPRRGANPFTIQNFRNPEDGSDLGIVADPVTSTEVAAFWTREKGGKRAYKFCSPALRVQLEGFLATHTALEGDYAHYLDAVNRALEATSQAASGIGTHGLRFSFARRRYVECLKHGYGDKQAKLLVSQEMGHNRADITETYLGC